MELINVIEDRYSVRGFTNQEIEKEKLDAVLEAGRLAPTGVNFQPFKVYVIDTKENKEELTKIYSQPWFVEAPIVLAVVVDKTKSWTRPWDGKNIADIDGTIVMDHMILRATDLGLGTCYIAAFKKEEAIEFLDLDENEEPVLFTPLGYPNAKRSDRPRKPIDELVVYK
ncbi:MAG: nitroreductase family protein [Methanobrevibacter sp.]|jgi:nitroreductase|nr:nitroreductase family protein [Candidatus Methanoflexus mossambicus]